jgi:type I restriction enzyme S subunit
MKSNYKCLGDFIKPIKVRNSELKANDLQGINVNKHFMPSVANIVGTDLSNYKLVQKNQFACNRMHVGRDYRIPIAVSESDEPFMVSPAYDVFEIKNPKELLPEYLMMWFSRKEFDRNAWFYTDADVRGGLPWNSFCEMQLPIPHIDKQKEIVKEYNTLQNRIQLNEQLIQKLEETAQAIYREWFVEFEFPDENGKPYKRNGGKMVWNEELGKEIPEGWEVKKLEELTNQICVAFVGSVYEDYCNKEVGVPMLRTTNITENGISYDDLKYVTKEFHQRNKKSQLSKGDLLVARHGSNGMPVIYDENFEANSLNVIIIKPNQKLMSSNLIYNFLTSDYAKDYILGSVGGSVQEVLNTKKIADLKIIFPADLSVINSLSLVLEIIGNSKSVYRKQLRRLVELKDLLLSRLASIK